MRRTLDVSLHQAWIWGMLLLSLLGGLTFASIGMGAWNGHLRKEAGALRISLDSLKPRLETLDRQAMLVVAVERVIPSADKSTTAMVAREIDRNAILYGFDPLVILAVVVTESGLQADAMGHTKSGNYSGAQGVMQIKPATARAMASAMGLDRPDDDDLADPAYNLSVGVAFLLQMVHRYQDLRLGIMAYNVGPGGLESGLRGERTLPEGYYRKVWMTYRRLTRELGRI